MKKTIRAIFGCFSIIMSCSGLMAEETSPLSDEAQSTVPDVAPPEIIFPSHFNVTVLPFVNRTGNSSYDAACTTAMGILTFTLKSVDECTVTVLQQDPVARTDADLGAWTDGCGVDVVLYGEVQLDANDTVQVRLWAYNRIKKATIVADKTADVPLMDMFSACDQLSLSVAAEMTGRHIGFARVDLVRSGENGNYEILIDGKVVGKDLSSIAGWREGSHEIIVRQERMFSSFELYRQTLTLEDGVPVTVKFSIPRLLPDEKTKIDGLEAELAALWNDEGAEQKVAKDIAEYSGLFSRIDYCTSLSSYREKAAKYVSDRETYKRERQIDLLNTRVTALEEDIAALSAENRKEADSLTALSQEIRSHFPQSAEKKPANYKAFAVATLIVGVLGCTLCGVSYWMGSNAYSTYTDADSSDAASSAHDKVSMWNTLVTIGAATGGIGLTTSGFCFITNANQHKVSQINEVR